jgi:hypothetical protein
MTKAGIVKRAYVALALSLSITAALFSLSVGIWQLAIGHLFVAGALAWGYLRPMDLEALEEVQRVKESAEEFNT